MSKSWYFLISFKITFQRYLSRILHDSKYLWPRTHFSVNHSHSFSVFHPLLFYLMFYCFFYKFQCLKYSFSCNLILTCLYSTCDLFINNAWSFFNFIISWTWNYCEGTIYCLRLGKKLWEKSTEVKVKQRSTEQRNKSLTIQNRQLI